MNVFICISQFKGLNLLNVRPSVYIAEHDLSTAQHTKTNYGNHGNMLQYILNDTNSHGSMGCFRDLVPLYGEY